MHGKSSINHHYAHQIYDKYCKYALCSLAGHVEYTAATPTCALAPTLAIRVFRQGRGPAAATICNGSFAVFYVRMRSGGDAFPRDTPCASARSIASPIRAGRRAVHRAGSHTAAPSAVPVTRWRPGGHRRDALQFHPGAPAAIAGFHPAGRSPEPSSQARIQPKYPPCLDAG